MIEVFSGPTGSCVLSELFDSSLFHYNPPAKAGDIYRAARTGTTAILLIDGIFGSERPPWIREILFEIQHKLPVIGCASIGAIRAAELFQYGMIASGTIAERYVRGAKLMPKLLLNDNHTRMDMWLDSVINHKVFIDDDDVAVIHAGPEMLFQPYTLPMVNFVVSFEVLDLDLELKIDCLVAIKSISFRHRTWNLVDQTLSNVVLNKYFDNYKARHLIRTIRHSYKDQKTIDAKNALILLNSGESVGYQMHEPKEWKITPRIFDNFL